MGFGKDGKGAIVYDNRSQALGGLAGDVGIIVTTKPAITEDFRMLKSVITASITGLTAGEGADLQLWLADGDLSLAEFEECVEVQGPLSSHDIVGNERTLRACFLVGKARYTDITSTRQQVEGMNGSLIMEIKPRWTFGETTSWNWIVYNDGNAVTTGATIRLKAKNFGVWIH